MSDTVYLHYDQAALDAQINLRARWPDHEEWFARWASESAAFRAEAGGRPDLAYGPTPGQTLDLFLPGTGPAPLVAFIHGGYWQALDKSDFSYLGRRFLERGVAYASLNYDLAPETRIGEMVGQIRRALAWLAAESGALGLDPGRIQVAGHSAGGHLAAMALATDWQASHGLTRPPVSAACAISGVFDLEPLSLCYQQPVLQIDAATLQDMSPLRLRPAPGARLVCAVGGEETDEFLRQQAALEAAWSAAGAAVEASVLEGHSHFSICDVLLDAGHPLTARLLALAGASEGGTP